MVISAARPDPALHPGFQPIVDLTHDTVAALAWTRPDALTSEGRLQSALSRPLDPPTARIALAAPPEALLRSDQPGWLLSQVERWGLTPSSLELYLPSVPKLESSLVRRLEKVRTAGFALGLGGFGERASMSWLREVSFDVVELAPAYTRCISRSPRDKLMFSSLVDLAHRLGAAVTATHVHTEGQVAFARLVGVDRARGDYFAR
jgi:EAL domain-containing protein (putative c-di-GMP-specific phosphodiesterase class I)